MTVLILACPAVRADAPERGTHASQRHKIVMIAAPEHEDLSLQIARAVRGQLRAVDGKLEIFWSDADAALPHRIRQAEKRAAESGAEAVFWCQTGDTDRIYLYFTTSNGGRVLVREISNADDSGLSEELAVIVASSVEAVRAGGEIGVSVPPPEGPTTEVVPNTPGAVPEDGQRADRVARARLELWYALDVFGAARIPTHGPGIAVGLDLGRHLALDLGYHFALPVEREAADVSVQLWRHPISLSARAVLPLGGFRLSAGLSAGIDLIRDRTRAPAGTRIEDGGIEPLVTISPLVRVDRRLGDRVRLFARGGAELAPRTMRYEVATSRGRVSVFETRRVRPAFALGAAILL